MQKKNLKVIGYSLIVIGLFFCFFFFYDAALFEAEITERQSTYTIDIALRAFFSEAYLPEAVYAPEVGSLHPTAKGWFLLVICLLGVPVMLGYRLANTDLTGKK